ncbi:hypothetical protein Hanom_Chr07g00617211 [Helianthus anomalus]
MFSTNLILYFYFYFFIFLVEGFKRFLSHCKEAKWKGFKASLNMRWLLSIFLLCVDFMGEFS